MTFAKQDVRSCSHDSVTDRFAGSLVGELDSPLTQQDITDAVGLLERRRNNNFC